MRFKTPLFLAAAIVASVCLVCVTCRGYCYFRYQPVRIADTYRDGQIELVNLFDLTTLKELVHAVAIDSIVAAKVVARLDAKGHGFAQLLVDPLEGGVSGDARMADLRPSVIEYENATRGGSDHRLSTTIL